MAKNYGGRSEKGQGGDMAMKGLNQGDMSPAIKDYQRPESDYSQEGFSKTLEYIERQNNFTGKEASRIEKQAYMGRYS